MPEDKSKAVEAGQSRVVDDQDHEVSHRAETPTSAEVPKPIEIYDRHPLYAAAEALKLGWIA